jgi:hypothetical protein
MKNTDKIRVVCGREHMALTAMITPKQLDLLTKQGVVSKLPENVPGSKEGGSKKAGDADVLTILLEDALNEAWPEPTYSINRLSEILVVDRRTLKKVLTDWEPDGKASSGPTYRKHKAVVAMLIHKRGAPDMKPAEFVQRLALCLLQGHPYSLDFHKAFVRYDLASYRGVEPGDLTEDLC